MFHYFLLCMFGLARAATLGDTIHFDVPAGPADTVLTAIAKQANRQILFPLESVKPIHANGVYGDYAVADALRTALQGTDLKATVLARGGIAVSYVDQPSHNGEKEPMHKGLKGFLVGLLGALLAPSTSMGQAAATGSAAPDQNAINEIDTVVITGTLIKRKPENSQLVTTIDLDEIMQRGATDASDIMAVVSQNQFAATGNDGTRAGSLTSLANLRALGPENTLVLINGRRVVNNPIFDNGVDLNTIPFALIESVDVLADGASAIYGSDAVAGVINFHTKKDFQGLQYTAQNFSPEHRGGDFYAASLGAGVGSITSDGFNLIVGGSWRERKEILSKDRSYADTSLRLDRGLDNTLGQPFPANFYQESTNVYASPYPCTPPNSTPSSGGACRQDADAAGLISLQNPERQVSAYGRAATLLAGQTLSLEYLWAESRVSNALTGSTLFGYELPPNSPYFPGNGVIPAIPGVDPTLPGLIYTRYTPSGRRTTENLSRTDRLLLDYTGTVGATDFDVFALRSTSRADINALEGALLIDGIDNGLAGTNGAPFINPFGDPTPAEAAYLDSIQYRGNLSSGTGTLNTAGASVSRHVFDLPGGPASVALEGEFARETFKYQIAGINAYLEGNVAGNAVAADGDRNRHSLTAEILLPVLHGVSVDVSGRYDYYSDFGHTFNPKFLVDWDLLPTVNVHASYNKGFRAPPLPNLFAPQSLGIISGLKNDPVLCPNGVPNTAAGGIAARDCSQAFNALHGGNPDLSPQRSTAYTAGLTFRLKDDAGSLGQLRATIDYWHYDLTDTIGTLSSDAVFADPTRFAGNIIRCSQADPALRSESFGCQFPGSGDPIAYVTQTNQNLGTVKTQGVDLGINWSLPTRVGRFGFEYRGTIVGTYQYQSIPGDPFKSRKGAYHDGFPVIPYTHFLNVTWDQGAFGASLQNQFKAGYDDCNAACVAAPYFDRVGTYSLWNISGSYRLNDAFALSIHINNLFDQNPPWTNGTNSNCTGCDLRYIDATGRAFGIAITGKLGLKGEN